MSTFRRRLLASFALKEKEGTWENPIFIHTPDEWLEFLNSDASQTGVWYRLANNLVLDSPEYLGNAAIYNYANLDGAGYHIYAYNDSTSTGSQIGIIGGNYGKIINLSYTANFNGSNITALARRNFGSIANCIAVNCVMSATTRNSFVGGDRGANTAIYNIVVNGGDILQIPSMNNCDVAYGSITKPIINVFVDNTIGIATYYGTATDPAIINSQETVDALNNSRSEIEITDGLPEGSLIEWEMVGGRLRLKGYTDYVTDGLVVYLDGIQNTKAGHNIDSIIWEDLVGNMDVSLSNFAFGENFIDVTGYIQTPLKTALIVPDEYTMEIVYHYTGTTYHQCGFSGSNPMFKGRPSNAKSWWNRGTGKSDERIYYPEIYDINAPQSMAMSQDSTGGIIYHNGVQVYNDDKVFSNQTNQQLVISGKTESMIGKIFAIRFYSRKLTAEEVYHNYTVDKRRFLNPLPSYIFDGLMVYTDAEYNTSDGHIDDSTVLENLAGDEYDFNIIGALAYENKGLVFDGIVSNYISVPEFNFLDNTEEVTYELTMSFANLDGTQRLLHSQPLHQVEFYLYKQLLHSNAVFDGTTNQFITPEGVVGTNQVITMAVTFKSGEFKKFYCNGVEISAVDIDTTASQNFSSGTIGQGKNAYPTASGNKFYSMRVYNRALSTEELLANYNVDKERFEI